MSHVCFRVAVCMLAGLAGLHAFQSSPVNRPWPPDVQQVPNASPPLPPDEALNTFYMPPGYRLELVASEPLVKDPVAIDWDARGRLWVVEMPGFMPDITAAGEHDPIGRVVVLEDADGDGRMDRRTVFADGLVLARSLKVLDRGVLVAEPPNVWLMRDTNGDLRMDERELVTDQYGHRDIDPQNNANGFFWALDNRMYTAGQADVHLRLKDHVIRTEKTLRRGEWGVSQDDAGRIYRNTNESALHVDLVPTAYYARNPHLVRTRGSYERLASEENGLNTVWPVRPNPGTNRAYQAGIDRADGTLAKFTSVCAPLVYRGDRLPPELRGNVFVAEPAANLVSRLVLTDDGTTLQARKAYEKGEFLASTDERFRPVYLSDAPDGTLYVVDMYRGIIEHRISITEYLRDQIRERNLETPTGYGRIYRVVHETTERDRSMALVDPTPQVLVETLTHPSGWRRDLAQRLLVERADRSVVPALVGLTKTAGDARTRLHALWTLDGLDAIEPALLQAALEDPSRDVRAAAIRMAERWLAAPTHPLQAAVLRRLDDGDWAVRHQLAASIGALPAVAREKAAVAMLAAHADDPVVLDAVLSGLYRQEAAVIERLLAGERSTAVEAAVTMLAATVVRGGEQAAVQGLFERIADAGRASWQRSALLAGAEVALLNRPAPATASARPAAAAKQPLPCPTCPGGRAGPGGAYAFPRPASWAARAAGGGPTLRLDRAPDALLTLTQGELGDRVVALLARVSWPGKPGAAADAGALSAVEQQRFEAGREVYRNVCQACHQPDGRGQDKIAPPLVGSVLTLAAPEIPIRVLLNGKEGPIGLMPPIGSAFDDEQVAAVLTYVRRAWGQQGTPVSPGAVAAVRKDTAGRTRAWKHEELVDLLR